MEAFEIDLDKLLNGKKEQTVWDRPVPIVKVGNTYHCYITDDIESPSNYNELCFLLDTLDDYHAVVLHINTGGGWIDSAFKIIASIKRSRAFVLARLTGTVASAGTIISLSCDELEVEKYTHFMIHNYSTGTQGKGHEVMDYINFNDKTLKTTFKEVYKGFLTDEEMTEVLRGKDMWLDAEDVQKRWETKRGI